MFVSVGSTGEDHAAQSGAGSAADVPRVLGVVEVEDAQVGTQAEDAVGVPEGVEHLWRGKGGLGGWG